MGDVIQPLAMKHLLASLAPEQCFWYAHPGVETPASGKRVGEFFGSHESRLVPLEAEDAQQVCLLFTMCRVMQFCCFP